jgi:hypothetical protein
MPRVVNAGVPMRMPDGSSGGRVLKSRDVEAVTVE